MNVANTTILVTGANRGIGRALVDEAVRRGAARVYAGTRKHLDGLDARVVPLELDLTNAAQINKAAGAIGSLDILINNAGLALYNDFGDRSALEAMLAVNLLGTYDVTQALLPQLTAAKGTIVNISSITAIGAVPALAAYSITKAGLLAMSQALRALAGRAGVKVQVVLPGPVDTDMTAPLDIPKATPASVARAIFDGIERGDEEIFPDPVSSPYAEIWPSSINKTVERQMSVFM